MRTELFLIHLEGNDCEMYELDIATSHYLYKNKNLEVDLVPVPRQAILLPEVAKEICDRLQIPVPNQVIGEL